MHSCHCTERCNCITHSFASVATYVTITVVVYMAIEGLRDGVLPPDPHVLKA